MQVQVAVLTERCRRSPFCYSGPDREKQKMKVPEPRKAGTRDSHRGCIRANNSFTSAVDKTVDTEILHMPPNCTGLKEPGATNSKQITWNP
jgi:hypothetical protein